MFVLQWPWPDSYLSKAAVESGSSADVARSLEEAAKFTNSTEAIRAAENRGSKGVPVTLVEVHEVPPPPPPPSRWEVIRVL